MWVDWSKEDLDLLRKLHDIHGGRWKFLAVTYFPHRTENSVRNAYHRQLSHGNAITSKKKRFPQHWTVEELRSLAQGVLEHGEDWSRILRQVKRPGTKRYVQKRWQRLLSAKDSLKELDGVLLHSVADVRNLLSVL